MILVRSPLVLAHSVDILFFCHCGESLCVIFTLYERKISMDLEEIKYKIEREAKTFLLVASYEKV